MFSKDGEGKQGKVETVQDVRKRTPPKESAFVVMVDQDKAFNLPKREKERMRKSGMKRLTISIWAGSKGRSSGVASVFTGSKKRKRRRCC
jgi:hypothetical protein